MAGDRHIDFSSELKYCNTKQYSTDKRQRDSVVSTDLSTNDEVEMTHRSSQQSHHKRERDVEILVLRDRSNLSLALRKLQCGSECLPGEVCSKCYKNQSSAISFISTSSCRARCEKCHHQVSLSQSNILFNSPSDCFTPLQDDEGDKMSQVTTDEVDGSSSRRRNSTAVIVDTFFKLAFLKVLIVDIGISIGKMPPNDK